MKRAFSRIGLGIALLAVLWFTGARFQRQTSAWAIGPVQTNGMRLAYRTIAAPSGQAPVGVAGGTPHFIQFAWVSSTTSGVDGYNLYGAAATGGENGTSALNGAALIPPTVVTTGCPPAPFPAGGCVLYTLNQPTLQNGFFVIAADLAGDQSAFSNEVGPIAVPVNPLPPGAATVASKQ